MQKAASNCTDDIDGNQVGQIVCRKWQLLSLIFSYVHVFAYGVRVEPDSSAQSHSIAFHSNVSLVTIHVYITLLSLRMYMLREYFHPRITCNQYEYYEYLA